MTGEGRDREFDGNKVFEPGRIGPLDLKNRVIRTAAFEGMYPGGRPSSRLVEHHRQLAAGGIAMTTVSYCAVSSMGKTFGDQMVMSQDLLPDLRVVTKAVHDEGSACSIQLGHAGYFADKHAIGATPMGASRLFNTYGMALSRPMTESDINSVVADFGLAAELAAEAGFDAVEIHLGHGYLLSQFLSPYTNRRRDRWGGSLENRLRLPLAVVDEVRKRVGGRLAVIPKINMTDGFSGGLELDEALLVAATLEEHGVDALVLSGGFVSKTPFYMLRGKLPVKEMVATQKGWLRKTGLTLFGRILVQEYEYRDLFFLDMARRARHAVDLPLIYVGGVTSLSAMEQVMDEGFEFVALGRALIMEPDLVNKMERGELESVDCDHCNRCVAEMENNGIRCVTMDERRAAADV
ncbi:MAG: NADH:flavin oxidoreductase [Deltaproteobacteria bacterium]|nr:NADH:flavin oxidoreductase [Deltaproteobacteria bacterium]